MRLDYVLTKEIPTMNYLLIFALGLVIGLRVPAALAAFSSSWRAGKKFRYCLLDAGRAALGIKVEAP